MKTFSTKLAATLMATLTSTVFSVPAFAQSNSFALELNDARDVEQDCRLTYVATNNTGAGLSKASYEVAVFDQEGVVSRLLLLEFGALQADKTKVVQFRISEIACSDISRLLVNSAECVGAQEGSTPNCMEGLTTSSRAEIQFGL